MMELLRVTDLESISPLSLLASNLPASVIDACRRLEDVGLTSVPSAWAGLDAAFRAWRL